MRYSTIADSYSEFVVSRSKFMSFAYHVESEEEVAERLKALRKTYHDATHVCYAAVWDELGNMSRFSDDGEPGGTAGAPIMDVIKGNGQKQCLIAVVRYFGGVKLGTGGLTRAYSQGASDVIAKARRIEYVMCDVYDCRTDFATFRRISGISGVVNPVYSADVSFEYVIPTGGSITPLVDKSCGRLNYAKRNQPQYKEIID